MRFDAIEAIEQITKELPTGNSRLQIYRSRPKEFTVILEVDFPGKSPRISAGYVMSEERATHMHRDFPKLVVTILCNEIKLHCAAGEDS